MSTSSRGLLAGLLAYLYWGLIPLYWKLLTAISAIELLQSRLILTALSCLLLLRLRASWPDFRAAMGDPAVLKKVLLAAGLLAGNWYSFMWAVNSNRVLESSLGYFLVPIVNVLLGRFAEKEHLGPWRWLAVGLASAGVAVIIAQAGHVPVAAISIAVTWGGYGLMKKRTGLGPLVGLGMEVCLLSPLAILVLAGLALAGPMTLPAASPTALAALAIVGFVTTLPLLMFAYAMKRVPLSTMGMGQYLVPSGHFLLAIAFGESVSPPILAGFGLIWLGLIAYSLAGSRRQRNAVDATESREKLIS